MFIIKTKSLLLALLIVLVLLPTSCSKTEQLSATELLDLGERYLLELDYEQAVVAFTGLIKIEPKNPRGYTGAAEAYVGLGEKDKAIDVLREGLEQLPLSEEISAMLDGLLKTTTNSLLRDELEINGILLGQGTVDDFAESFGYEIKESSVSDHEGYEGLSVRGNMIRGLEGTFIIQANGSDHVGYLYVLKPGAVGPRGIIIGVSTRQETMELLNEEEEKDTIVYHFSDEVNGNIVFSIRFNDDDIVDFMHYMEEGFWSYAENV